MGTLTSSFEHIGVIGAGAWGTALASVAAQAADREAVLLWAFEPEVADSINADHENKLFLPGIALPENITVTNDLEHMIDRDALIIASPAQFIRHTAKALASLNLPTKTPLIICSKGIENDSCHLMSEVVAEFLPENPIAILTGPSFAGEVAQRMPVALTLACKGDAMGDALIKALATSYCHISYTHDIIGAQVGGAVKNVIAIGCGITAGLKMGDNVRAALIAMGLQEMGKIAEAKGGHAKTLMQQCGIGDLVLTCSSMQSRNMSLGYALGEGRPLEAILKERKVVTEGVMSAQSVYTLTARLGIHAPLCDLIYHILYKGKKAAEITEVFSHA
jgi:glycerol-3-phosphate dehydrogenase (NAD(P)+)